MAETTEPHSAANAIKNSEVLHDATEPTPPTKSIDTAVPSVQATSNIAKSKLQSDLATVMDIEEPVLPANANAGMVSLERSEAPILEVAPSSTTMDNGVTSAPGSVANTASEKDEMDIAATSTQPDSADERLVTDAAQPSSLKRKASPSIDNGAHEKRTKLLEALSGVEDPDASRSDVSKHNEKSASPSVDRADTPVTEREGSTKSKTKTDSDGDYMPDSEKTSPEKAVIIVDSEDEDDQAKGDEQQQDDHSTPDTQKQSKATAIRKASESNAANTKTTDAVKRAAMDDENGPSEEYLALAQRQWDQACGACRKKATKALNVMHRKKIADLKRENRDSLSATRKNFKEQATGFKEKAAKELQRVKDKHAETVDDMKEKYEKDTSGLKERLSKVERESEQKHDDMKKKLEDKLRKATHDYGKADESRKELEKKLKAEQRDHEQEQKANEAKLKMEKKQFLREQQTELKELRPEHSSAVKAKEKELKQKDLRIQELEAVLKQTFDDNRALIADASENEERFSRRAAEVSRVEAEKARLEDAQWELERRLTTVEHRAKVDVAREHEKLELARQNAEEQTRRLVQQQRANAVHQQAAERHARGAKALVDELGATRAELKSTRSRLGEAEAHLEGLRVVATSEPGMDGGEGVQTPPEESMATGAAQDGAGQGEVGVQGFQISQPGHLATAPTLDLAQLAPGGDQSAWALPNENAGVMPPHSADSVATSVVGATGGVILLD